MKILAFNRYPQYIKQVLWWLHSYVLFYVKKIQTSGAVYCFGIPIIERHPGSEIVINNKVSLCSDSRYTALGVSRPVILRTLRQGASIVIGEESGLSGTTICASRSVHIGKRCLIGADVMISDTDFHHLIPEGRRYRSEVEAAASPVVIGNDVFVGARVIILKGVSIGDGSVIGAGSVVTRDIPAGVICVGNPAKVVRHIVE